MKIISTDRYHVHQQKETDAFLIFFVTNKNTAVTEIILQAKNGSHRANFQAVNILSKDGAISERRPIDKKIAEFIFQNFEVRGDTESFSIYEEDLLAGCYDSNRNTKRAEIKIRHQTTDSERSFTSKGDKLYYHYPIFDKLRETGFGSIIRATMTLHQVCASSCPFCSTISRNRRDSISLDEAKNFVNELYYNQADFNKNRFGRYNEDYKKATGTDIRLKGLILSGGGQPNLWPYFSEFVEYLSGLDIDLGLITNGFPKHVPDHIYNKFKWVRISITPEDASPFYPESRFDFQYIPSSLIHNSDVTVGYSYIYGPWTDDEIFGRISRSIDENGFRYCRVLTDCNLTREMQILAHRDLAESLRRLKLIDRYGTPTGKVFHQLKVHGDSAEASNLWSEGQCYLQAYNVFWDTTGHEEQGYSSCFACDSVTVLTDSVDDGKVNVSERRFDHSRWGTVNNLEVSRLFTEPLQRFFDPRDVCKSCLFTDNNRAVKSLISDGGAMPNKAPASKIEHLNFP